MAKVASSCRKNSSNTRTSPTMSHLSGSAQCSSCGTRCATRSIAAPCASARAARARPCRPAAAWRDDRRDQGIMKRVWPRPPPATPEDAAGPSPDHLPVLLDAVLAALMPCDGAVYVDGTFGAGGYSAALLAAAQCRVLGIDRDPESVRRGAALASRHAGRLMLIEGCFGDIERLVGEVAPGPIAGIAFDLGVSSIQLDNPERGFSFRHDGPLDMRMSGAGRSAADLVAGLSEEELAGLIRS